MFISVNSCFLDADLLACETNQLGYPLDTSLAKRETEKSDELRRKTIELWQENKALYELHAADLRMDYLLWDDEYPSFEDRLQEMSKNDV